MPAPTSPDPSGQPAGGGLRCGSVAGVEIFVSISSVAVVALLAVGFAPRVTSVEPDLGGWAYALGAGVGVLVYLAAFAHEISHAVVARAYGHRVESITLSAMGGRTVVDGEASTPSEELATAAVGPLSSLALGALAFGLLALSGDGVVSVVLEVMVLANLVLGALDLLPAPPLDGGRIVRAAGWWLAGSRRRGGLAAAWSGRLVAVGVAVTALVLRVDVVYLVTALLVAVLLVLAAEAELGSIRLRDRIDALDLATLARPVLRVAPDEPWSAAAQRADADGAVLVAVDTEGEPLGVIEGVEHPGLTATPRAIETLPAHLRGAELLRAIGPSPREEYLLVRPDGQVDGVLVLRDLDRALRRH